MRQRAGYIKYVRLHYLDSFHYFYNQYGQHNPAYPCNTAGYISKHVVKYTIVGNTPLARFYANSATQSPQVSDPASTSPESLAINKSRGLQGRRSDHDFPFKPEVPRQRNSRR
ncbi:hypothetical protein N7491_008444 [Penicillium cf. griseofulvum]|uniref:Uncharacterized protein n=1 Tax=Penicillium cf. griseofulvum TaxID=2972120 RepID=A0A9W9SW40_9EURO|nr:hypothetical protein N7472_005954 [Penicillium cf. griseofulvum]KAJ5423228.1 hypothetical protein N7491_008444 [Penicillium cf. griseofulvum]